MGQGRMGQLANQRSPGMRLMNANDTHECEWDCRFFHRLSCPVLHLGLTDINGGPQCPAAGGRFNVKTSTTPVTSCQKKASGSSSGCSA
ncbi:hypothetical protein BaRGS_00017743 [Batillaria attramentaria]|uniref:Uncharacterized protein n=1 Tax=Batillaria attramentaria TaxID=370345 RepID=A0ABD0KVC7_9CAEN